MVTGLQVRLKTAARHQLLRHAGCRGAIPHIGLLSVYGDNLENNHFLNAKMTQNIFAILVKPLILQCGNVSHLILRLYIGLQCTVRNDLPEINN
jgi:hypothetical protein